jgi:hypothetical protein
MGLALISLLDDNIVLKNEELETLMVKFYCRLG